MDAVLVLIVILANALLSAAQEVTARRTLRRLLTVSAVRVRVHRTDGSRLTSAEELVAGDVVSFETGDAVPADCRIISGSGLEMDESTLTGESTPVAKSADPTLAVAVADRTSMVYAGTTVAAGTATAVVVATGRSTEAGRSEHMIVEDGTTGGVQARLAKIAAASIPASAAAAAGLFLAASLRGRLAESVSSSVALAVAAIPEGLPFVATVAELSASKRLARHNILVRNPRAMEALGRVDTVCFDKTGTLTEGRIQLRAVSDGRSHEPVEAAGPESRRHRRRGAAGKSRSRTATRFCPTRPTGPSWSVPRTPASAPPTGSAGGGWCGSCHSSPAGASTRCSARSRPGN